MENQREIKFRAWDKEAKIMRGVSGYRMNEDIQKRVYILQAGNQDIEIPFDELELMQFTGLKDKNGKEIYEGDIVKWDKVSGEVKMRNASWIFEDGWLLDIPEGVEVIGNIYENKELLK